MALLISRGIVKSIVLTSTLLLLLLAIWKIWPAERITFKFEVTVNGHKKWALVKDCILTNQDKFFDRLVDLINTCAKKYLRIEKEDFFEVHVGRFGEIKVFRKFSTGSYNVPCSWLTIGIGGDVEAEKEFLKQYPTCSMFGMDPKVDQGQLFNEVGAFIPFGLSKQGGNLSMTVRKPEGNYVSETVPTISMDRLLSMRQDLIMPITFVTLDIEGGEYFILPEFGRFGAFTRAGARVCQMDVELHGPSGKYLTNEQFYHFFKSFLHSSDFLPIFAKRHLKKHAKVTLVNIADADCHVLFDVEGLAV